ncbi:MAG: hypothetical protein K2M29_09150 [Paramuribaculum sp.]|nr:hypothetical protein [Paramuribaculum sp.]
MLRKTILPLIALLTLIYGSQTLTAQNTTSPYSKYGYGLLRDNANIAQRQMGYTGYAMTSGREVNMMNPASYAAVDTLTFLFDMGLDLSFISSSDADAKRDEQGGGLDYISMLFPVAKNMGVSIGLVPYSSVGYAFGTDIDNGLYTRQGNGGINQLYAGYAIRPFKGFSIGANISYLFGNTQNVIYAYTTTGSTSAFAQTIDIRDWNIQAGIQYTLRINPDHALTAALTYSPGKTLLGHATVTKQDVTSGLNELPDTLSHISLRNNFSIPDKWGAGLNYRYKDRLQVEADFTYMPWSNAKFAAMDGFEATRFADRYQGSIGASYTHAVRGNYFSRITYRIGALYNRDYMTVSSGNDLNHVREYALTCGLGLPTMGSKTMINLGFEYRHRQATPNPLLKETYCNITLGINFNELWFFKNKIR